MKLDVELQGFAAPDDAAAAAAKRWRQLLEERDTATVFSVLLSGGRVARSLYRSIASETASKAGLWENAHLFWADERCVPPDDPDSNYGLARDALLGAIRLSEGQVHRIRGELEPALASREAESEACRLLPVTDEGQPIFDLALLGMGEDGHVASLFPGEAAEATCQKCVYRPIHGSPKPPSDRVTIGYPALAVARELWVLVTGEGKAPALRRSLRHPAETPLGKVLASRKGRSVIFYEGDLEAVDKGQRGH